jgi:cytochrome c-type biogenesis protein CcmF
MVQERRHTLKLWTLSLSLGSFLLTILGTFMTRSGVFNSVHSFTQSEIGPTFLVFLGVVLLVSIVLIAVRGPLLVPEGTLGSVASRETAILLNNLLFAGLTFTVLLGTVFPLVREAFSGVRISVGAPYFNRMAVPLGVAILFLMGVGPSLPWGRASAETIRRQFLIPAAVGVAVVIVCVAAGLHGTLPLLTFGLAGFVLVVTVREMALPIRIRMREHRESLGRALWRSAARARRRFGGYVVHLGVVLVFVAIAASQSYVVHTTATLTPGKSFQLGTYTVALSGLRSGADPHRRWTAAEVDVTDGNGRHQRLAPRMNFYERSTDPVGSPAIRTAAFEDLYLTLLAFDGEVPSASFNAWIFPMVAWIWWSLPLFVLGALIAAWPERRRARAEAAEQVSVPGKARSPGAAA